MNAGWGAGLSSFSNNLLNILMQEQANQPSAEQQAKLAQTAAFNAAMYGADPAAGVAAQGVAQTPAPIPSLPTAAAAPAPQQFAPAPQVQRTSAGSGGFLAQLQSAIQDFPMPSAAPPRTNEQVYQDTFTDSFYDGPAPRSGYLGMEMQQNKERAVGNLNPENLAPTSSMPSAAVTPAQQLRVQQQDARFEQGTYIPPQAQPGILAGENIQAPGAQGMPTPMQPPTPYPGQPQQSVPNAAAGWLPGLPAQQLQQMSDRAFGLMPQYPVRAMETLDQINKYRAPVAAAKGPTGDERLLMNYRDAEARGDAPAMEYYEGLMDKAASHPLPSQIKLSNQAIQGEKTVEERNRIAMSNRNKIYSIRDNEFGLVSSEEANKDQSNYISTEGATPAQENAGWFYRRIKDADRNLRDMTERGYEPSDSSRMYDLLKTMTTAGDFVQIMASNAWLTADDREFISNVAEFTEANLRLDTGAAAPGNEYYRTGRLYEKSFEDTDADLARKKRKRGQLLSALRGKAGIHGRIVDEQHNSFYNPKPPEGIVPSKY